MEYKELQDQLEILIKIWMDTVEANKGTPDKEDGFIRYGEGLAIKYLYHIWSIYNLSKGININNFYKEANNILDPITIDVIVRTAYETSLVFYYIYVFPHNEDEKKLIYNSWRAAQLTQRQNFPIQNINEKDKIIKENELLIKILEEIKNNQIFKSCTPKEQKKILNRIKRGEWKDKKWSEIAELAGYSDYNSKYIYRLLCDRAHSGNLSVMQTYQAIENDDKQILMKLPLNFLLINISFMIKQYCDCFSKSKEYFINNIQEPNLVTLWYGIGSGKENLTIFDK